MTARSWAGVAAICFGWVAFANAEVGAERPFDILHYDANIEPDIEGGTVKGDVRVDFASRVVGLAAIDLDIGALTIDVVEDGRGPLEFTQADRRLHVSLRSPVDRDRRHRVHIKYHGAPRFGLEFHPGKSQVYTVFSTGQWMPCVEVPSERATFRLNLVVPNALGVVGNGKPGKVKAVTGGRSSHEWRLESEAPAFMFGFAVGKFTEVLDERGRTKLRYLGAESSADELRRIFADTPDMLAFFEERAGVRYGGASYTQALVEKTIGQELSDFSLMSVAYGRAVLEDPNGVGLIAHEFAHQWWGNRLTCRDWTHFWLNEGFATFMAAAYRERRFGRDAYLKDVEGWRARYERVKSGGKDRSLVFPDWNRPTSDDRALVYQKGALVLHELRAHLGEEVFWDGLRAYTRAFVGKSVVTADFQHAMEKAAGRSLSAFFDEWVYVQPPGGR